MHVTTVGDRGTADIPTASEWSIPSLADQQDVIQLAKTIAAEWKKVGLATEIPPLVQSVADSEVSFDQAWAFIDWAYHGITVAGFFSANPK